MRADPPSIAGGHPHRNRGHDVTATHPSPFIRKSQDESPLRLLAGPEAMERIRRDGLHEDLFDVVAGASGGAKWLGLTRLDQALFGRWFRSRTRPLAWPRARNSPQAVAVSTRSGTTTSATARPTSWSWL